MSLKLHPATVRIKHKIILAIWNMKKLNQCGQLENIKQEINVNILGEQSMEISSVINT